MKFSAILLVALMATALSLRAQNLGEASTFGLLALNGGSMTINSSSLIVGDVGYSNGVVSTTNQKAENFTGGAYVHSGATFNYTAGNFLPSDGVQLGSIHPAVNARLDQANVDALLFAASLDLLGPTQSLGFLGDNDSRVVNSSGGFNVIDIGGIDYNSDSLTLRSRPGFTDSFIVRIGGDMDFSQSSIILDGLSAANVLFYFPNASSILINKDASVFKGTILAPTSSVIYHNPATFDGAIIADSIDVHSDFRLNHVAFVPEPSTALLGSAGLLLLFRRRR